MAVVCVVVGIYLADVLAKDPLPELPPLQNGDLIFQTAYGSSSLAIMWATKSLYDHMGIILREPDGVYVLEAKRTISKTPLPQWIQRGKFKRITVLRDPRLTTRERSRLVMEAQHFLGKPYDYFYQFDMDALYCSELIYHAYRAIDKSVGQVQRVETLDVDNFLVTKMLRERWQGHPLCKGQKLHYAQCRERIMNQRLITPVSIAKDKRLEVIYDNYPF